MPMSNDPMTSALQDAAQARQETRERITVALRGPQGLYGARQAHGDGQEAIARHRHRAQRGARVVIANETRRLFGDAPLYAHQDTAREHDRQVRITAITDRLNGEQDAAAALDRLLTAAHVGDNLMLAGGVAAKAMAEGWESVLGVWVASPMLGGSPGRGGWATVEKIRAAQAFLAGDLPPVLQDLPPLAELAEAMGLKGVPAK